jgi:hypothetical protein
LAALATVAVAPAVAQDKPMKQDKPMTKEGMNKPVMHRHVQHHHHHHYQSPRGEAANDGQDVKAHGPLNRGHFSFSQLQHTTF